MFASPYMTFFSSSKQGGGGAGIRNSAELCCKNCNNAAEKVGASNMQMILYQDVVHARAALGVQAP